MDSRQIAASIQGIDDSMRAGFSEAAEEMMQRFEQVNALVDETGDDLETVLKALFAADQTLMNSNTELMKSRLFGGTTTHTRQLELRTPFLDNLFLLTDTKTHFF